MGGKTVERVYPGTTGRVFEACRRAVADLGYTMLAIHPEALTLSFNTGRSMKSWNGQDLSASIFSEQNGSRVVVGGTLAKGGTALTGGGSQLFAWGEKRALSDTFLARVASILPSIAEVPGSNSLPGAVTAAQAPVVPGAPPAGWYADPEVPGGQRWWDGRVWGPQAPSPARAAVQPGTCPNCGHSSAQHYGTGDGTHHCRSCEIITGTV